MNQVERWFGLLTGKLIRRGMHTSVLALENDIKAWIATWNDNPRPFTWTKTADETLIRSPTTCAASWPARPEPAASAVQAPADWVTRASGQGKTSRRRILRRIRAGEPS